MIRDASYMHEHIKIDLSKAKKDIDCKLDSFEESKNELKRLKELGVSRIADMSNMGMGRDAEYVKRMESETGIEIFMSTGYYKDPFLPKEAEELSAEELAELMIKDIKEGIDGTDKKAYFIGEIGTSVEGATENERKIFLAAALAQKETKAFISTHTSLGRLGHEQLDMLERENVDLEKIIIGHTDLSNDLEYMKSLLNRGAYIAFDTIGKTKYLEDSVRAAFLKELCDTNWEEKILLSLDITRRSHLKINGGIGYSYLIEEFIPMLEKAGIEEKKIQKMLSENPKKIFGLRG